MPIYEYICSNCNGRFQKLVSGFGQQPSIACPRCHGTDVNKAVSRFAVMQSEESRLEAMADPASMSGLDENDPRSVARWAKKMGQEMGEDLGEDWDQMVDEMMEDEMGGGSKEDGASDDLGWG